MDTVDIQLPGFPRVDCPNNPGILPDWGESGVDWPRFEYSRSGSGSRRNKELEAEKQEKHVSTACMASMDALLFGRPAQQRIPVGGQ